MLPGGVTVEEDYGGKTQTNLKKEIQLSRLDANLISEFFVRLIVTIQSLCINQPADYFPFLSTQKRTVMGH